MKSISRRLSELFPDVCGAPVAERVNWWIESQTRFDEEVQLVFEQYGKLLPTERLLEWQMEWKGGDCMLCGDPYRPTHVLHYHAVKGKDGKEVGRDPVFADFTLWVPNCRCYKTCERTGRMVQVYTKTGTVDRMQKVRGCDRIQVAEALFKHNGSEQRTCLGCGGIIL